MSRDPEERSEPGEARATPRRSHAPWWAALIFALAGLTLYHPVVGAGFSERTLLSSFNRTAEDGSRSLQVPEAESLLHTDGRYLVWLTARGAHALLHRPWAYFDAESCFPGENTLAYGETGLALAVVGLPVFLLTGDPVATFNSAVLLLPWIAAFSMFLLVREWSGSPAAGIVAGLVYGFGELRAGDVVHVNVFDTTWTALSLLFATRVFTRRRWRDAAGLAACIVLQLGTSFYTTVAAAFVGVPVAAWLARVHGLRALPPARIAMLVVVVALATALLLSPYLAMRESGELKQQTLQYYISLTMLLPPSPGFWGWTAVVLAGVAALSPRDRLTRPGQGDPRIALAVGTFLVVLFATGAVTSWGVVLIDPQGETTTPYMWLAKILPGAEVVRSPGALLPASAIGVSALAGLGAAALLARVPARYRVQAAVALVVLAALETLRPPALGLTPRVAYATVQTAPDESTLALYREAAALGNDGPILSAPLRPRNLSRNSRELLLSAYHWRKTSACYNLSHANSVLPGLARRLPDAAAIRELARMGFTTLDFRHPPGDGMARFLRGRFERSALEGDEARLERLVGNDERTLYRLVVEQDVRSPTRSDGVRSPGSGS